MYVSCNAVSLWVLQAGVAVGVPEGTLQLLHGRVAPIGEAAPYPHSYFQLVVTTTDLHYKRPS